MIRSIKYAGAGLATAFLAAAWSLAQAQTVKAVAQMDDTQFRGTWYQIARYPDKREKKCVGDAYELIARANKANSLQLVDSCKTNTKGGYAYVHNYTAVPQNKKAPDGRLKITTLLPFSRKYWILATAPDQTWFVAGSPDHKGLWVYAKTATMDATALQEAQALAGSQGFAADRLVMTPQDVAGATVTPMVVH